MVDVYSVVGSVLSLGAALAALYVVLKTLLPELEQVLEDYTGDQRVASLFAKFATLYIGLYGLERALRAFSPTNIPVFSELVGAVASAVSTAFSIVSSLQWFIYIAVLLFIGHAILQLRDK